MSEEQDQVTQARTKVSKKISLITFPIKIVWGIFKLALWALMIYLVVYFLIWAILGFDYAYALLQSNYDYLVVRTNQYSDSSWVVGFFHWLGVGVESIALQIMGWLSDLPNNQALTSNINSGLEAYQLFGVDGSADSVVSSGVGFTQHAVSIIAMALLISLMKLATSMVLMVMYIVGIVLGILTGNRKRLYRRIGIDRESDAKYKVVKFVVSYVPLCVIVLYMVLPFNLNPLLVFFVIGVVSVVLFYSVVSRFKKYL
ncbi:DUF4400 domain-containing protein [Cysteiniphilum marinum]|uniref:DUF4400 domain-containing protein n=1 Tax=Cysteiniphilum marinum TaxID=2774191 RepID=UPI00193ACCF1|nr:DUF4400 domain-containing protein [Cysteiniphilum marinum]